MEQVTVLLTGGLGVSAAAHRTAAARLVPSVHRFLMQVRRAVVAAAACSRAA